MNKTEQAFYDKYIEPKYRDGTIIKSRYERLKIVLAPGSTYTPDFMFTTWDGKTVVIEIKGFWREDDRVKIKVASDLFPEWYWFAVTTTTKTIKKIEGFAESDPEDFKWLFQST